MGIAHAENGRPIIFNGDHGLPGPDNDGNYPLVVYSDWYEAADTSRASAELGEVTVVPIDGKDIIVAVNGLHEISDGVLH